MKSTQATNIYPFFPPRIERKMFQWPSQIGLDSFAWAVSRFTFLQRDSTLYSYRTTPRLGVSRGTPLAMELPLEGEFDDFVKLPGASLKTLPTGCCPSTLSQNFAFSTRPMPLSQMFLSHALSIRSKLKLLQDKETFAKTKIWCQIIERKYNWKSSRKGSEIIAKKI